MIHTAVIAGHAIEADVIGVKLPGKSQGEDMACVYRLGPPANTSLSPELQHWPLDQDSPFSVQFEPNDDNGVCKLTPQSMGDRVSFMQCFKPFHPLGGVVDAVSMRFDMPSRSSCSIVFLRCGSHSQFSGNNIWMLKHLYPLVAKDVRRAHADWTKHLAWLSTDRLGPLTTSAPTSEEVIARLSKTEMLVLDHLRLRETEREVAQAVGRSPHTIHVHVKSIYRKLMVTSRKQLMAVIDNIPENSAITINPTPYELDRA
jgi:DNA-binding CsgD family transcriptional regulator